MKAFSQLSLIILSGLCCLQAAEEADQKGAMRRAAEAEGIPFDVIQQQNEFDKIVEE